MEPTHRFDPQSIALLRTRLGIKQVDLAADLGVAKKEVSDWETGKAVPSLSVLGAIYSIGAAKGQAPEFFAPVKPQGKIPAPPPDMSVSVYWDMQNIAPSKKKAVERERVLKAAVENVAPGVKPQLRGFASPSQKAGFKKLTGWDIQTSDENWDERLISEVRKATKEKPASKTVFLVTGDTDYRALIKELLARGVTVHLCVLAKVSQRLVSEVKPGNVVTLP